MIQIVVSGVVSDISLSHTFKDVKFYSLKLHCKRLSETEDVIPVIIPETYLDVAKANKKIMVRGTVTTKSIGEKVKLFVFGQQVCGHDGAEDVNDVMGTGFVVKKSDLRHTPKSNRTLLCFTLASNSRNGSSYIPTMAWNKYATAISNMGIGEELTVVGRLQSRDFNKYLSDGSSEKQTTYELSVKYVERGGKSIA